MTQNTRKVDEILTLAPVIPVLVFDDAETAVPVARALVRGGLKVLEVTLRTPAALESIRRIAADLPDAVVGAGTVLDGRQYAEAVEAGSRFIVSPGCTPALLEAAGRSDVPLLPGATTPSEAMALLEAGYSRLKFFPAEPSGGTAMLKALGGPLPQLRFCPTGGIDLAKAPEYLALKNVLCVGGSWLTPAAAIAAGDWGRIEALAAEAVARLRPSK
ncbi:MAG TPA: bifunctional 4-hydroxy-2-oxoglutarate aldolase/2-dehydro-3-deoxy-phosphogluconate aldolase [Alphaproteobacteria bacterium]|nr:bifunctional 4-hydroxy-2-oxoglutarate aldolase/2-dehydro-3-deoxy-phosphogluconate aldolase [Alphaproteobacteria bacterium]